MRSELIAFRAEMYEELDRILAFWFEHVVDVKYGGFYGKVDNNNIADEFAPKGSVLNSRILWSFSAAYNHLKTARYLQMAERAYKYFRNYFIDGDFGGVYWTVNYKGEPLDTKKQIYALSFAVYGLSEYHKASGDDEARKLAIQLYETIVRHSYDAQFGGYIEALRRDWQPLHDLRLSEKDFNEKKSMNTHLHVLEGFANLYRIYPNEQLKQKIEQLIHLFLEKIIDPETSHLILFFDDEWNRKSSIISYGHDIEAAWLILEAAEIIKDESLIAAVKNISLKVADAAAEGLAGDGGLWYEKEDHLIKEKHWWPQSEAMVGFLNAWQLTNDESYLTKSISSWSFVKKHLIDKERGEWFWGVSDDYSPMKDEDKAGLWKCPYHNSRACLEVIKRIECL